MTDGEWVSAVELFLLDVNTQQCPEALDNQEAYKAALQDCGRRKQSLGRMLRGDIAARPSGAS